MLVLVKLTLLKVTPLHWWPRSGVNFTKSNTPPWVTSFWCCYCYLWTNFTPFSNVSIVDFKQVNVSWVYTFSRRFNSNIYLVGIYLLNVNKRNTTTVWEIFKFNNKDTTATPMTSLLRSTLLVSSFLTLDRFHKLFMVIEHRNCYRAHEIV